MILRQISKALLLAICVPAILGLLNGCGDGCDSSNPWSEDQSVKVEVVPNSLSMKKGTSQQYYAVAIYEDGTKENITGDVVWSSSNESVATISSEGLAQVLAVGEISIKATYRDLTGNTLPGISIKEPLIIGNTSLEVHDKPTSALQLYPGTATIPLGSVTEYRAVAVFADGTQQNVVHNIDAWLENDSGIIEEHIETTDDDAFLEPYALVKAVAAGNDNIIGQFDGVEGTAEVTVVSDVLLEEIIIEPLEVITTVGSKIKFWATGIYSDGSNNDLTETVQWETDNTSIATISNDPLDKGTATALAPGTTIVSAGLNDLVATANMAIHEDSAPELTSIEVNPPNAAILPAEFIKFTAIAHFSDHSIEDITDEAAWSSSDETVAVIGNIFEYVGLALGLSPGMTNITATYKGITSNISALTVKPPEVILESIDISPADAGIPKGTLLGYTALAFYSDGSTVDVTTDTTWESADPSVIYIDTASENAGIAYAVAEGITSITASYQGAQDNAAITVTPAEIQEIVLDPVDESVPAGTRLKYRAIGIFTDMSFADVTLLATWQTSDKTIATVGNRRASGIVSTHAPGTVTINASFDSLDGTAALEVTPPALQQIQVTPAVANPPLGTFTAFEATAYYSDGSSEDVTEAVTWESSDPAIVHVSNDTDSAGLAEALAIGVSQITAYLDNLADTADVTVVDPILVEITVNPVVESRPLGSVVAYLAVAIFSDGSQSDVTYNAHWRSTDPTVAQVLGTEANSGIVGTIAVGQTVIRATYGGLTAQGSLEVTAAEIVSLQITPANPVEPAGTSGFFTATAQLTDGTNEDVTALATWLSSDPATVTVVTSGDDAGLAVLLKEGTADISTTYGEFADTVAVTVTAAVLTEVQVSPVVAAVPSGLELQYHAQGIFSDGSKSSLDEEVAWRSEDISVATITPSGFAQALTPGNTNISASLNEISGRAILLVSEAQVNEIQITPANPNLPAGTTVQFIAIAQLTDGTTEDVTTQATWQSSDPQTVSMITSGDDAGLAVLLKEGTADISATYGEFTDTVAVQVTAAVLLEIQVTPVIAEVPSGLGIQYHAQGIFSDGSKSSLDEEVAWRSEDIRVATITPSGFAQALIPGDTIITATLNPIVGQAALTVSPAEATEIQITPATLYEPAGTSVFLTATAWLTDNTTTDVTAQATWTSSNPTIAFVGNSDDNSGFVTLLAPGSADITATYNDIFDTTSAEVTPAVLRTIQVSPLLSTVPKGLTVQYSAQGVYSDGKITPIDEDVSWGSNDPDIATINLDGLAQALEVGDTVITAALDDIVGQADLQVTSAQTIEIQITPGNISEPVGTSDFLTATSILTDGTTKDVTKDATWTSSAPEVAMVANGDEDAGFIRFLSTGDAVITATLPVLINQDGIIADSIDVSVTVAELTEILLSPVLYKMPLGQTVQFTADGVFTDGSRTPINSDVNWLSSDIGIVTIDPAGLADSISEGAVTITATHASGVTASTTLTVEPAVIVGIEMEPQNLSIAEGSTQQFSVTAILSDSSTLPIEEGVVWQSSDLQVAAIDQGLLSALSQGTATITATLSVSEGDIEGVFTDSTAVTVTTVTLVEISLYTDHPTIHVGGVSFFEATGEYNDGTLQDLTEGVTWISSDPTIAIVSNEPGTSGQIFAQAAGEVEISATFDGVTGTHPLTALPDALVSIAVEPASPIIAAGLSQQFQAIGTHSDGTPEEVTWNVNWTSDTPAVAEVDAYGLATSAAAGITDITASRDEIEGTASLTVEAATPSGLRVEPAGLVEIANKTGIQFNAILTTNVSDDDITSQVVWSSSDEEVATIKNGGKDPGYADSKNEGETFITADYYHELSDTEFTATATLTVLDLGDKPGTVEVRPTDLENPSITVNETLQFQLIGFWENPPGNEHEQDITTHKDTKWKSSNKHEVPINKDGLATGKESGDSNIEGEWKHVKDATNLTVTP